MKKAITILAAIVMVTMVSCKDEPAKKAKEKTGKFVAVYIDRTGAKRIGECIRVVNDQIKYDSVTNEPSVVSKTLVGYWTLTPIKDSLGKTVKAVSGVDSLIGAWQLVGLDSVNFHIENIPIDSLLKR